MKNVVYLDSREAIIDHVSALWQTDLIRNSPAVKKVVERFAGLPRVFADMSDDRLETAHFSTWWNVIMRRHGYTNPYIHDLYYLHEIYHAATMPYASGLNRATFDEKMQRNELEASVFTEIQIYFEIPELRAHTFDHFIHADTFLNDPHMVAMWKHNSEMAVDEIRLRRRNTMIGNGANDEAARWVGIFDAQNAAHTAIWTGRYDEIESHMASVVECAMVDGMASAANKHRDWLEAKMGDGNGIPFIEEATMFSPIYWTNKARFNASVAKTA